MRKRRPGKPPPPGPAPLFPPYEQESRKKGGKHRPACDEHLDLRQLARELARLLSERRK